MHVLPNTHDTIVAVSSAWAPSLVGVLRLSGPDAFDCVAGVVDTSIPSGRRGTQPVRVAVSPQTAVPGELFWFRAPHSYTAQDVIELHMPGSPPLLRMLASALIQRGARRALPGEFTARAFLAGKLDANQVERVSGLVTAESAAQARAAMRGDRSGVRARLDQVRRQLLELRARIEAGIDFVDEEDIRFITPSEVVAQLDQIHAAFTIVNQTTPDWRSDRLHVSLAGLPNAGKSTLFNALVGHDRAVVSPVLGTTRDVLAAEMQCGELRVVLQDCAGLGHTPNELELAAHLAAEQAADAADLVLWVHAADQPWTADEREAIARLERERYLIVTSKIDRASGSETALDMSSDFNVAAPIGAGLDALRDGIAAALDRTTAIQPGLCDAELIERLQRARELAAQSNPEVQADMEVLADPELICFELRWVDERLSEEALSGLTEDVLGWIFSQFCMGK